MASGDVERLTGDAVGVAELFVALRLRVDGKQLEEGRQLHHPAVLGVQPLPAVLHHEVAGKDDLVASPVRVLDGLDREANPLEPRRGMILAPAELVPREDPPLIPLVGHPGDSFGVVLLALVNQDVGPRLPEAVLRQEGFTPQLVMLRQDLEHGLSRDRSSSHRGIVRPGSDNAFGSKDAPE
ncbi:hypothetical protein ACIP6P_00855 [Streptomyces sp. NPDC088729]|uniref:hypothetical protein n=1 Tax=Streptomyces sp. NPDC088729 TaxID=3365876 RepID=UPI00382BFF11